MGFLRILARRRPFEANGFTCIGGSCLSVFWRVFVGCSNVGGAILLEDFRVGSAEGFTVFTAIAGEVGFFVVV
jgi:hypothetical protein